MSGVQSARERKFLLTQRPHSTLQETRRAIADPYPRLAVRRHLHAIVDRRLRSDASPRCTCHSWAGNTGCRLTPAALRTRTVRHPSHHSGICCNGWHSKIRTPRISPSRTSCSKACGESGTMACIMAWLLALELELLEQYMSSHCQRPRCSFAFRSASSPRYTPHGWGGNMGCRRTPADLHTRPPPHLWLRSGTRCTGQCRVDSQRLSTPFRLNHKLRNSRSLRIPLHK